MTKNKDLVAKLLDSFYEKIAVEKKAADDSAKKEKEGVTVVDNPAPGPDGKEKQKDVVDAVGGVAASSPEAQVKTGDASKPTDNQGPNMLAADEKVDQADNKIKLDKTEEKKARAEILGSAILDRIAKMQKVAEKPVEKPTEKPVEKKAEEKPAEKPVEKQAEMQKTAEQVAADQSYNDFQAGFMRGLEKRAEDVKEILASGIMKTAQEANAVLDSVAGENPEAVLPEEAIQAPAAPAEGAAAQMSPEDAAMLDQLAEQMAAQGVKPEDLMQAAKVVEELKAAGVSPEEIVQAAGEVGAEGAPVEAPAAAPEAAPEAVPADVEKAAAERKDAIKDVIRSLRKA